MRGVFLLALMLPCVAFAQEVAAPAAAPPTAQSKPAIEEAVPMGPPQWNPSWRYCRFNHECVLLKDECKQYTAVNTNYMRRAYTYFTTVTPSRTCGEPLMLPNPQPICNTQIRGCEVTY